MVHSALSAGNPLRLPLDVSSQQLRPSDTTTTSEPRAEEISSGAEETEKEELSEPQTSQANLSQIPVFGTSTSAPLSFAALASGGQIREFPAFGQRTEGFQFGNTGQNLFSPESSKTGQDDPEKEADIHFHPIVSLPEAVKTKSWDEDADTVYCQRAKLYRFDGGSGQWKDRGVGELKIMKHRHSGTVKLIMRRDHILKICCNHRLTVDMTLTRLATSEKAWMWFTSADYTDQVVRPEKLSVKFKTVQIASEFKEAFDRCKAELSAGEADDASREGETGERWEGEIGRERREEKGREVGKWGEEEEGSQTVVKPETSPAPVDCVTSEEDNTCINNKT